MMTKCHLSSIFRQWAFSHLCCRTALLSRSKAYICFSQKYTFESRAAGSGWAPKTRVMASSRFGRSVLTTSRCIGSAINWFTVNFRTLRTYITRWRAAAWGRPVAIRHTFKPPMLESIREILLQQVLPLSRRIATLARLAIPTPLRVCESFKTACASVESAMPSESRKRETLRIRTAPSLRKIRQSSRHIACADTVLRATTFIWSKRSGVRSDAAELATRYGINNSMIGAEPS